MKIKIQFVLLALGFMLLSAITVQAKPLYLANIGIGNKSMAVNIGQRSLKSSFTSLDFSFSRVNNNWFTSLNYEQSLKDGMQSYDQQLLDSNGASIGYANGVAIHSRADISLTVGYRLIDAVSVFAGVRKGQTDSYLSAIKKESSVVDGISSHGQIISKGAFAGINVNHRFSGNSSISASIAMAKLQGSASRSEPYVDTTNIDPNKFPPTVNGDALGFSYTLSWSNPISDKASINIKAILHRYHFEDYNVSNGIDLSYDENFSTALLELTYLL